MAWWARMESERKEWAQMVWEFLYHSFHIIVIVFLCDWLLSLCCRSSIVFCCLHISCCCHHLSSGVLHEAARRNSIDSDVEDKNSDPVGADNDCPVFLRFCLHGGFTDWRECLRHGEGHTHGVGVVLLCPGWRLWPAGLCLRHGLRLLQKQFDSCIHKDVCIWARRLIASIEEVYVNCGPAPH